MTKTNVGTALAYARSLTGTPYSAWGSGENTRATEAPFWASDAPAPSARAVKARGCICTGLANLMRRKLGLSVPGAARADYKYAGGTWIWFRSFPLEPLDITKAYPAGTLLLRPYKSVKDQGHVAVIYEKNPKGVLFSKLLHCYRDAGVRLDPAMGSSHFWRPEGYYTHVCLPKNWLR